MYYSITTSDGLMMQSLSYKADHCLEHKTDDFEHETHALDKYNWQIWKCQRTAAPSVLQWVSSHGCAPFTAGVAWLSDDYWWRQIDGVRQGLCVRPFTDGVDSTVDLAELLSKL